MYKEEIEYIKNKEVQKWIDDTNEQINKLTNNLIIASFINGINKLEELLDKNPIIQENRLQLHIEGYYESDLREIDTRVVCKTSYYTNEGLSLINIKNLSNDEKLINNLIKIIENFPKMEKEEEYIIYLEQPLKQIKEQLVKIFLNEENQIKYNHLILSSEISISEENTKVVKNKI